MNPGNTILKNDWNSVCPVMLWDSSKIPPVSCFKQAPGTSVSSLLTYTQHQKPVKQCVMRGHPSVVTGDVRIGVLFLHDFLPLCPWCSRQPSAME